ncbi:unnamed protein product [Phaedon cochleariae]|uniref:THAP-type domain-containing protein n=1 Tax=Phaedon cochleariae TaxID=80249 RepID=A0A9P0DUA4_PHACE|nr:unnamed protein product [Phaedon cochleariae]
MPGLTCAVFGCKNNWASSKTEEKLTFHVIPRQKDFLSTTIRNEWIACCNRPATWNPDNGRICSAHFCDQDYERDLQHELLGLPLRKRLKKTAIPTQNLPGIEILNSDSTEDLQTILNANTQVDNNHNVSQKSTLNVIENEFLNCPQSNLPPDEDSTCSSYKLKYNELLGEFTKLKENYTNQGKLNKSKIKTLNNNLRYYKYFEHFNRTNHSGKGIVRRLASKIKKHSDYPLEIITGFFKLRTIIKMNFLNMKKEENIKRKRQRDVTDDSSDSNRKRIRKLYKITS